MPAHATAGPAQALKPQGSYRKRTWPLLLSFGKVFPRAAQASHPFSTSLVLGSSHLEYHLTPERIAKVSPPPFKIFAHTACPTLTLGGGGQHFFKYLISLAFSDWSLGYLCPLLRKAFPNLSQGSPPVPVESLITCWNNKTVIC